MFGSKKLSFGNSFGKQDLEVKCCRPCKKSKKSWRLFWWSRRPMLATLWRSGSGERGWQSPPFDFCCLVYFQQLRRFHQTCRDSSWSWWVQTLITQSIRKWQSGFVIYCEWKWNWYLRLYLLQFLQQQSQMIVVQFKASARFRWLQ